jgi:trans-aconitate methyltransferase
MAYKTILFPGRHLAFSQYQGNILDKTLQENPEALVLFIITSANQENCRYNPIPLAYRAIAVDRFAQAHCRRPNKYRIITLPHYPKCSAESFVQKTLKECELETQTKLHPEDTLVLISTPSLMQAWQKLGFPIHKLEASLPPEKRIYAADLAKFIGESEKSDWQRHAKLFDRSNFHFFLDHPHVASNIQNLWKDPLFSDSGNISDLRDYNTYSEGMQANIQRKFEEIRAFIKPGRIVDEGCADGSLLKIIAAAFPDSDLIGVDGSAEFIARAQEAHRQGAFKGSYVHFYRRNLLSTICEKDSITTTISNSTVHEIYSYNDKENSVRSYLKEKYQQLAPGGVLLIRDVVGPENGNQKVFLHCQGTPRENYQSQPIADLNITERFLRFLSETGAPIPPQNNRFPGKTSFFTELSLIMEFVQKMDYVQNWESELKETFCFWSHSQWIQELKKVGFLIDPATHAHTEPWLLKNRFTNNRVFLTDTKDREIPWPVTHQILVATKPS